MVIFTINDKTITEDTINKIKMIGDISKLLKEITFDPILMMKG